MKRINTSAIGKLAALLCLMCLLLVGESATAFAQRSGRSSNSSGGGLPNAGRLLLQLNPSIVNRRGREDDEDKPRRVKPKFPNNSVYINRGNDDDDDGDDDGRPATKRVPPKTVIDKAPPRRLTAVPVPPPARLTPPPSLAIAPTPQRRELAERPQYQPAELVVMVRAEQPDTVAAQLAQGFNLVLQETLSFALLGTSRVYRFSIPDGRPVETVVASIAAVPGVGFAAPNSLYWLQGGAGKQAYNMQYALPKMRVPAAQAIGSGRGMTIAVIDSGVDAKHPSLKSAHLKLFDVVAGGIAGPDMHGTAITGIIAASGDMIGIAPEAKIVAVRAFAPEKLGMPPVTKATTLASAVQIAFDQGARIYNMSFAGARNPLLIEMIDAAYAQGAVFVAAAGNEGPDAPPAFPAAHDKVIAITATDEADEIYDNANRGRYVLAAAPGVNILAPVTGKGFDYLSGTSFAAAHVTGVIALMMERNPKLSAQDVRRILVDSAHDLGAAGQDADFGAGLTDAYGSLLLAGKP